MHTMRKQMERKAVLAIAIALSALVASQASAASRSMIGSITIENPSAGFELTPGIYGKPLGGAGPNLYPPTDGPRNVSVDGTAMGTSVGRQISIAANQMNRTGQTRTRCGSWPLDLLPDFSTRRAPAEE